MPTAAVPEVIQRWHALVAAPEVTTLRSLLAPEAVFRSPAVHTPQSGADLTFAYLWAAINVLGPTLEYRHEWYDESSAVLRFSAEVGGLEIDGIDMITWNEHGAITDFTVMVRPFKGLQAVIAAMGAELEAQRG